MEKHIYPNGSIEVSALTLARYVAKRLLAMVPVVLAITTLVFWVVKLTPGDPALAILGGSAMKGAIEQFHREFGLDRPLHIQFLEFLEGLILRGDLGKSYWTHGSVAVLLSQAFPATAELTVSAMIVAILVGGLVGIISAVKRETLFDYVSRTFSLFGVSMPIFLLGPALILVFSVYLGLLPVQGRGGAEHLVLPAFTLGMFSASNMARIMRSSMLDVLGKDYVRTARAKGLSERVVIYKHALRNALVPFVTVAGLQFGLLLGGAIICESVYAWPGVGRLLVSAILQRDSPVIQGCILFIVILFVLVNLTVDVLYHYLDPRIRT